MKFSRNPIITKLRNALSGTILYRPARFLYNTIRLFNAQRTVAVGSLRVAFWTPTFKIIDDLEHIAEKEILLSFLRAIHTGDTVWDIGANIGLYTLFAAKTAGEQGRVIAVEPEPKTRSLLLRNVALNHIRNVTVLDCALGKEETTKPLYPSATPNPGSHSFVQRTDYKVRTKGIPVAIYPGDKLVLEKNVGIPHIVKIDVEGAELDVLLGMSSILHRNTVRMMLVEVHPNVLPLFKASANDVERVVQSFGFSKVTRLERGTEYHLLCYREVPSPSGEGFAVNSAERLGWGQLPMYTPDIKPEQDEIGLCRTCIHTQFIKSAKGSTFILCTLSKTDPSFPKYPRLPVLRCSGYRKKEIKQQEREQ